MSLDPNINTLERAKFVEVAGETAVRVAVAGLAPAAFDTITVTYPTSTTEVYTYSLAASPVGVVTVTYVSSTKEQVSTVVRT